MNFVNPDPELFIDPDPELFVSYPDPGKSKKKQIIIIILLRLCLISIGYDWIRNFSLDPEI